MYNQEYTLKKCNFNPFLQLYCNNIFNNQNNTEENYGTRQNTTFHFDHGWIIHDSRAHSKLDVGCRTGHHPVAKTVWISYLSILQDYKTIQKRTQPF